MSHKISRCYRWSINHINQPPSSPKKNDENILGIKLFSVTLVVNNMEDLVVRFRCFGGK